jgi:hypothetical protein
MAALTTHRGIPTKRNDSKPTQGAGLIETSAIVFVGSFLVADQTTGLLKVAADIGAAGSTFAGLCTGFSGLTGGVPTAGVVGNGTIYALFETDFEILVPCAATVNAADVGNTAYLLDDEGVTDVSTAGPACGVFCPAGQEATLLCWVKLGASALPDAT